MKNAILLQKQALVQFHTIRTKSIGKEDKIIKSIQNLYAFYSKYWILINIYFLFQLYEGFEDSGAHAIFLPKALPVAQIVLTGSIYTTLAISIER